MSPYKKHWFQAKANPTSLCFSYPVLHSVVIRFSKYSLLENFCDFCLLFLPEEGWKAGSCNDREEGKKIKTDIHRSHLGGKFGIILLVKMGRNKEEDGKGILRHILEVVSNIM